MFATLAGALLLGVAADPAPRAARPQTELVRITKVDPVKDKLTIERTILVTELFERDIEVELLWGLKATVREWVGGESERQVAETYTLAYMRLADRRGTACDWAQAEGKTVLLYRGNQLPDRAVRQLLAKGTRILYARD